MFVHTIVQLLFVSVDELRELFYHTKIRYEVLDIVLFFLAYVTFIVLEHHEIILISFSIYHCRYGCHVTKLNTHKNGLHIGAAHKMALCDCEDESGVQ